MACCPAHDDRSPSLHVTEGKDGRALLHGHAGCPVEAVLEALGLGLPDLFPNRTAWRQRARKDPRHELLIVGVLGKHVPAPAQSCDGVDIPPDLPDAHRAVLDCLRDHAFFAPTCCPSQQLIAAQVGLTREYVNRVCRDLGALGLISWVRARRAGSRWEHNVYTLLVAWDRPHRARVMARIKAAKERMRRAVLLPVHTKRRDQYVRRTRGSSTASLPRRFTATRARNGPQNWSVVVGEVQLARNATSAGDFSLRCAERDPDEHVLRRRR